MKIEIDLSDIFCGDESPCDLQEAIRQEVVDNLTAKIQAGIGKRVDEQISAALDKEVTAAIALQMPAIIDDLINATYTPVTNWGERKAPTTLRSALVASLNSQMVYKRTQYEGERNVFTKAVDSLVSENLKTFQAEFNKLVTADFTKAAMAHATAELKKKLGFV